MQCNCLLTVSRNIFLRFLFFTYLCQSLEANLRDYVHKVLQVASSCLDCPNVKHLPHGLGDQKPDDGNSGSVLSTTTLKLHTSPVFLASTNIGHQANLSHVSRAHSGKMTWHRLQLTLVLCYLLLLMKGDSSRDLVLRIK